MLQRIKELLVDEDGVTTVEYALLLGLISVALVTAITPLRNAIVGKFTSATTALTTP